MDRPYIICHMTQSIDGKVTGNFLCHPDCADAVETYYEKNRQLKGDAFACGRITMEGSFTNHFQPDFSAFENTEVPEGDFIAEKHHYYAVSFDRHGAVGWTQARIHDEDSGYDNCHIIEVLCEDTPKSHLAYYRSIGVSYIFAGEHDMNLELALDKLYHLFGIRKLLLEGGSIINGAFERENLIDEISLVIAPIAADKDGLPLFHESTLQSFELAECEKMNQSVWLRYRKKGETS